MSESHSVIFSIRYHRSVTTSTLLNASSFFSECTNWYKFTQSTNYVRSFISHREQLIACVLNTGMTSFMSTAPRKSEYYILSSTSKTSVHHPTMSASTTLKIACFHGYCQNATLLRQKTGALRKSLERKLSLVSPSSSDSADNDFQMAELFYINAPFILQERPNAPKPIAGQPLSESDKLDAVFQPALSPYQVTKGDTTKRSWWAAEDNGTRYNGYEKSISLIKQVFLEKVRPRQLYAFHPSLLVPM